METRFQTSFIPKQPVTETARRGASSSSLFFLITFVLLTVSVVLAIIFFLWDKSLDSQITKGNLQLKQNENAFDQVTIQELTRLNNRINSANTLLKQHIAVSNLFDALQNNTLKNVRFNNFNYTYGGGDKIVVTMNGQAVSYETVALQSRAFTNPALKNVFRSPLFDGLNLDNIGNVTFNFTMGVDPTLLSYYKTVTNALVPGDVTVQSTSVPNLSGGAASPKGGSTSTNAPSNSPSTN